MKKLFIHNNKNNNITIELEKGLITSLYGIGKDLCKGNKCPLFVVSIIKENNDNFRLSSNDFKFIKLIEKDDDYVLTYDYFEKYIVRIHLKVKKDPFELNFKFDVENHTNDLIEWFECPGISFDDTLDGTKDSNILWLFNEGSLVSYNKDKMWPYEEPEYPSYGSFGLYPNIVESQYMAYLYNDGGLYIGCHDTENNVKQLDFYHKDNRIKIQLRFYSGVNFGEDFSICYDIVLKFFVGSWQDASMIYREFFEKNTKIKKIEENNDLPLWYKNDSLVVLTLPILGAHDTAEMKPNKLYPYDNLLKVVEKFSKRINSKLLVLLMQWESTAPWAPPYMWPPYGGEEQFKNFSKKIHEMGHYLGLYCSGLAWTQQSNVVKSYNKEKEFNDKHLEKEMCVGINQKLEYRRVCVSQVKGYDFCPTSKVLKDIYSEEVKHIYDAGVDYLQLLDQNHGGGSYFCFSKSHGHPPVPGKWQVDAVNDLLSSLKKKNMLFGCESAAAEAYLDNLNLSDNRPTLAELVGDAVPAYQFIYHSRVNNFMGNQCCCSMKYDEDDYNYRLAYSFLAGDLLTIVINEDEEIMHHWGATRDGVQNPPQNEALELIKNLNNTRRVLKEYLIYGEMIKPLEYKCSETKTFYVFRRKYFEKKERKVLSNAFRYNNKRMDFFVNYTNKPVEIELEIKKNERFYSCIEDYKNNNFTVRNNEKIVVKGLSVVFVENHV